MIRSLLTAAVTAALLLITAPGCGKGTVKPTLKDDKAPPLKSIGAGDAPTKGSSTKPKVLQD
jgi:hypothetical protein